MRPPFIVTTPIRNEEWILKKFLLTTSLWADHILILDSGCSDQSLEIARGFPKVQILPFKPDYLTSEHQRRYDLFHATRIIDPQAIVFTLDADEIISAEILQPSLQNQIVEELGSPGTSLLLPWIMLWKNPLEYRTEPYGIWSNRWMRCVYWDDGKGDCLFEGFLHFPRVPRHFHQKENKLNLSLLHYQFAAWKRTQIKQAHWRAIEWDKGPQTFLNSLRINLLYSIARETWDAKTQKIPKEWTQGYELKGIDLTTSLDELNPWFLHEMLNLLSQGGTEKFALIDIWDLPWDSFRQQRGDLSLKFKTVSLDDPRSQIKKFYHQLIYLASFLASSLALRILQIANKSVKDRNQ